MSVSASVSITGDQAEAGRFSLMELRRLHQILVQNKNVSETNQDLVVEVLRILAEMVVYGDNKSELLFDFFCEKNMLSLFLEIMRFEGLNGSNGCPSVVHVQVLQTLSILINCVKNDTSLYYLLSNNYVNQMIIFPHVFDNDESLRDQFVSFMKSLSLRLNRQTVQFFFIEETGAFPILTRAIELLSLPDSMCRIAAQSTILNVYKVIDRRSREYALQDEMIQKMFAAVVFIMHSQYEKMAESTIAYMEAACSDAEESSLIQIENRLEDMMVTIEDWLYYLQDLMDLKIPKITENLIYCVINDFVYKCLLNPSVEEYYYNESNNGNSQLALIKGMNKISAFVFILQMIRIITDPVLHSAILIGVYHPLNQYSRQCLLNYIALSVKALTDAQHPSRPALTDSIDVNKVTTEDLESMQHIEVSNNGSSNTPVLRLSTVGSAIEDNNQEPDCAKADSNMENIVYNLLNKVEGLVSGSAVHEIISEQLGKMEDLVISDESGIGVGVCDPDPVAVVVHDVAAADQDAVKTVAVEGDGLCTIATNHVDNSDENLYRKMICDSSFDRANMKMATVGLSLLQLLVTELISASTKTFISFRIKLLCSLGQGFEEPVDNITQDFGNDEDEELIKALARRQISRWRMRRCIVGKPANAVDILQSLFILQNRKQLSKDEREARLVDGVVHKDDPFDVAHNKSSSKASKIFESVQLISESAAYDFDPELMSLCLVVEVGQILQHNSNTATNSESLAVVPYINLLFQLINAANSFSLTNIQIAVNIIYSLFGLLIETLKSPDLSKEEKKELRTTCAYFMDEVGNSSKAAAAALLERTTGSHAGLLLKMLQEEVCRAKGRKWSTVMRRLHKDVLLLLPSSPANTERLGVDFDKPDKMTEIIQKEIQVFLLMRALFNHVRSKVSRIDDNHEIDPADTSNTSSGNIDDLYSAIMSSDIISIDEKALIPSHMDEGSQFDMRGKRFLDATLIPNKHGSNDLTSQSDMSTVLPSYSSPSTSLSWGLSWYMGSSSGAGPGKRSPVPAAAAAAMASSPSNSTSSSSISDALASELGVTSPTRAAVVSTSNGNINADTSAVPTSANLKTDSNKNSKRLLTGLSFGKKQSTAASSVSQSSPISPTPELTIQQKNALQYGLLFVQDPSLFIVVSQDKTDLKTVFQVYAVAPILYSFATKDKVDKRSFQLLVRSSRELKNMERVGCLTPEKISKMGVENPYLNTLIAEEDSFPMTADSKANLTAAEASKLKTFLRGPRRSIFWQLTVAMETEEACNLAVKYIESRRQDIYNGKMKQLRELLENWLKFSWKENDQSIPSIL